jgi:hypothetical protein
MKNFKRLFMKKRVACALVMLAMLALETTALWPVRVEAATVLDPAVTDVKVTLDNNNVDGLSPTASFDARNRPQNETSVAISPVDRDIVAIVSRDRRLANLNWIGVNISNDGGATWFNTMIPGFPSDTSPAGLASPLKGRNYSSDPSVRFDGAGNLYVSGVALGSDFYQSDVPDNFVYVAKYHYTPGTPAGVSTFNLAANPPDFTYAFTTVVELGAISFRLPPPENGYFAGQGEDKPWLAVDTNPSSPGFGNIYIAFTTFTLGAAPVLFSRSSDGGSTFSQPLPISVQGSAGTLNTFGPNIAVGSDGRIYVSYQRYDHGTIVPRGVDVVRSDDCGRHFGKPVPAASGFVAMGVMEPGVGTQTELMPGLAVDDTNPDVVYVAYMAKTGSPSHADIFVARSTNGGTTWEAPVKVNDDATSKHQFFPTMAVSNGALHVAWYDFRDSPNPGSPSATNTVLNVYYASSNTSGVVYPAFSHNVKVTDVGFNPQCVGVGFLGDYIELAARFDGLHHVVHVAWADARDIPPAFCAEFPPGDFWTGVFNTNIYTARLLVVP